MSQYLSLCLLSYNRPRFIEEAINSALEDPGFPIEIVVHDDGSTDLSVQTLLLKYLHEGRISKLILSPTGHNQGVGESIRAAFGAASGDVLVKADQDLIFKSGWAQALFDVATDTRIGFAGLFKYDFEPVDHRKTILKRDCWAPEGTPYEIHTHICASLFGIRADVYDRYGIQTHSDAFAEDTDLCDRLKADGFEIALTRDAYVVNRGFGIGPSTVCERPGPDGVAKIKHETLLFAKPEEPAPQPEEVVVDEATPERPFRVGVVMPIGTGREDNVREVLADLDAQYEKIAYCVLVYDGIDKFDVGKHTFPIRHVKMPKHHPGMEQPRNVGVHHLIAASPECNYVWFLDSDVRVGPETLQRYAEGYQMADVDRILIGPYVFMNPGIKGIHPQQPLDSYRTAQFTSCTPADVYRFRPEMIGLNHGLATFSGNICWPIAEFTRIGGFWNEIHHGRCEDGEIGVRAFISDVPISYVAGARGYHQYHHVDGNRSRALNERDVPMINARHPYIQQAGIVITDDDGKRFEQTCPSCGTQINTLLWWEHRASCSAR